MFEESKLFKEAISSVAKRARSLWYNIIMMQRTDRLHEVAERLSQTVGSGERARAELSPKDSSWYGYFQGVDFENRGDLRVFTYYSGTEERYEKALEIVLDKQGNFVDASTPSWAISSGLGSYDMKDLRRDSGDLLRLLNQPNCRDQLISQSESVAWHS